MLAVHVIYSDCIFSFFPGRIISTLRYKPLPAFLQIPLPRCITLPSPLKTAPTKLVAINWSSNPDLLVNTQLWSTVRVQSTILSTNPPHLHRIHSTQQSPTNGNNEERWFCHCYKWDLWGLLHFMAKISGNTPRFLDAGLSQLKLIYNLSKTLSW